MKKTPAAVTVRAGNLEFLKVNATVWDWRDTYHWMISLSWPRFALLLMGGYVALNAGFAALYCTVARGGIAEMPPGSFPDAFFFSVETLATVGYGHMYPVTLAGHLLATAEIVLGMFGMAVVTGLIFVRFSRPTANLAFSDCLTLSNFEGVPTLMVRIANLRHQTMVEAAFRMVYSQRVFTQEGQDMAVFHELKLQMRSTVMFPAAMIIRHPIDEASPLHGKTMADIEGESGRFIASMVCMDPVVSATVQSCRSYSWRDVRMGERFVDIYTEEAGSGRLVVDYARLNETEAG